MSVWSWTKGAAKDVWGAVSDPFKGETVDPHEPDQENFKYRGQGEGYFQQRAEAADKKQLPWQVNAARQQALASRAQIDQQMQDTQRQMRDPNSSVAQQQLRAGTDANMAQSLALARSASGGAGAQAAALRQAQFTNSTAGTQANQQAATLRAQEQTGWQNQLNQLAAQQRASDLQSQGLEGQLGLGLMGEQTKAALGNLALGQQAAAYQQRGGIGYEQTKSGNIMAAQMANQQADTQRDASLMGLASVGLGGLAMASDVRGKVDIAPTAGTYAEGLNMPSAPSQERVDAAQKTAAGASPLAQRVGSSLMSYGMGQMQQGGQAAGPSPYSYLSYPGMVDSDARAKSLENENKALRDVIKDRAIDFALDTARDVSAPPGSPTLRRGSAGVAAMARRAKFTPDVVEAFAGGRDGTYSAPLSPAEQARLDRLAAGGVRTPRQVAVAAPAPPVVPGPPSLAAALPMPTQPVSDENAKDVLAALRQRATEGEPGSETAAFLQRARERLNENQEKKLDHALLSAGLDRVEREATVDGGAPRLQAGRTNVARFDDVPPTVQAVAQTPNYQWRYKDGFAAEANARAGLPPTAPQGYARRTGPMAQDLEKSPVYAPAVVTGPDGMKRVDSGTVTMANAGVLSDLSRFAQEQEERIRRLEAGRSRVPYPKPREAGL